MALGVLDMLRKAPAAELAEVHSLLGDAAKAAARASTPSKEADWSAKAKAVRAQVAAVREAQARAAATLAAAERQMAEARTAVERACSEEAATHVDLTPVFQALWTSRPAFIDAILAELRRETEQLWPPEQIVLPPARDPRADSVALAGELIPSDSDGLRRHIAEHVATQPLPVSNRGDVEARQAGLRKLAEHVEGWVSQGTVASESELRALLAGEYKALPAVRPLRAILAETDRGRAWLKAHGQEGRR